MRPLPRVFAMCLREAMARKKIKNVHLAKMVGVDEKTVGNWTRENGDPEQTEPKVADLLAVCKALDVCADVLIGNATPGDWFVDQDAVEHPVLGDDWCWQVPKRPRVVTDAERKSIEEGTNAKKRATKGKEKSNGGT